jgi:hypothetical protein
MAPAKSLFSLAFSPYSSVNPFASRLFIPPNFAFRVWTSDPVLAVDPGGRNARLLLVQHRDNPIVRKPRSLHGPILASNRHSEVFWRNFGGSKHAPF